MTERANLPPDEANFLGQRRASFHHLERLVVSALPECNVGQRIQHFRLASLVAVFAADLQRFLGKSLGLLGIARPTRFNAEAHERDADLFLVGNAAKPLEARLVEAISFRKVALDVDQTAEATQSTGPNRRRQPGCALEQFLKPSAAFCG